MATIETIYEGQLRARSKHMQSGTELTTDAPTDNHGKGEAFSPTDLVATALGSCMLTIMDITVSRSGVDLKGTRLSVNKIMASDPRRIGEIEIDFYFPADYDDKTKKILERAADSCPVAKSLHPDLKQTLRFHYGKE